MIRVWLVRLVLVLLVLVAGWSSGGLSGVLGWLLLVWVLVRAAPALLLDVRALWDLGRPFFSRSRHNLTL